MASDPLASIRRQVGSHIADIRASGPQLSPLDIHARMDSIRQLASDHGLVALEGLARCSAQLALLPGHRIATASCIERLEDALNSSTGRDCTAILATVALRLH